MSSNKPNKSKKYDIMDIFDFSKKFEKRYIPGSQTQGYVKPSGNLVQEESFLPFRTLKGQSYARSYKLNEENAYVKRSTQVNSNPLDNVDEATSVGTVGHLNDIHDLTKVYNTYNFNVRNKTTELPIEDFRQKIVNMIQSNQVSIIQGPTGCGKTTQVPQFILDACYETREPCNIVITQPRRIAAITVAKRVSSERGWPLSTLVGYQVGLQNRCSDDTRLTFCTTGVLLQRLVNLKNLDDYTHIILDEVHERDLEMDFLLLIIRKMLRSQSSPVKVILMSATFNVDRFALYFSQRLGKTLTQAPILTINTNISNFQINYYYLEQLHNFGTQMLTFELDNPECNAQLMQLAVQLIRQLEILEKKEDRIIGGVLIFLPGINEIEDLFTILTTHEKSFLWEVYPLHSTITIEEQERVFKPATNGIRKIILSTNIAESSVTVPDIHYVIDFCLTKHLRSDPNSSFTSLQLAWASKTNCIQRAGRCGRVSDGHVYRLVTQVFFECLEEDGEPEMLRCPLERIVLLSKMFHTGEPKALLALALDPPDLSNIEKTLLVLKEIGAMDMNVNGVPNEYDGNITFMGRVMARLPIDIHLSKLILLGYVFAVLDECVIMAAAMSSKSIFSSPFKNRLGAYKSKLMWADQSCSDSIAFLNAYKVWSERVRSGYFERSKGINSKDWGDQFFIQVRVLKEVHDLVQDIQMRLKQMGLENAKGKGRVEWAKAEMPFVLKFLIAGAFYPNYFVRGGQGGQVDEREAVRKVVGRNPFNTVYYQGFPPGQPGEIYTLHFRKELRVCARDVTISFDGTNKVYVEFLKNEREVDRLIEFKSTIPGKIPMAVYRAVKLNQLKGPLKIPLLTPAKALEYAKKCGLNASKLNSLSVNPALRNKSNDTKTDSPWNSNRLMLPTLQESHLHLHVVHTIDPGHFWAQNADSNTMTALLRVYSLMNGGADAEETMEALFRHEESNDDPDRDRDESSQQSEPGHMRHLRGPPILGQIYAAPWAEGDNEMRLYRGRVDAIYQNGHQVEIFFIDFGNNTTMASRMLLEMRGRLFEEMSQVSAQAFECVLRGIQPSLLENSNSQWTKAAREYFEKKVNIPNKSHMILFGRVYSVVHGVVSLDLILQNKYLNSEENINDELIERGYAEPVDESYLSKANHDIRLEQSKLESDQRINTLDAPYESYQTTQDQIDVIPPSEDICNIWTTLRGPFSPLEMKLYNLTRIGIGRQISIEWNSVNSVLLDTYPGDVHERLLIAGGVTQNSTADRLSLRHTTLMPNIHGLASLITMIFAPSVEIRLDRNKTHYTGALCGLGFYPDTNRSLFPDHDMEVMFDTRFTFEDLKRINSLRRWIDKSLHTEEDANRLNLNEDRIIKCQRKVRDKLLKLVREKRESLDLTSCARPFLWNQMESESNVDLDEDLPDIGQRSFPPHMGAILVTMEDKVKELIKHHQKLQELARGGRNAASHGEDFLEIQCRLCAVTLYSARALSLHLLTLDHKDRVTALYPVQQSKDDDE